MPADSLAFALLVAAEILARVDGGESLSEAISVLGDRPDACRAEAQELAYGSLRAYGRSEYILQRLLHRPLPDRQVEALLRAAIYRLDTEPATAYVVVDQAVEAAAALAGGAFKGLVNAVLRNFVRQRSALTAALDGDELVRSQHPRWWLARLRRAYPERWQEIVAAGNSRPPMTLRINRRRVMLADYLERLQAAGYPARQVGPDALLLATPVPVALLPGFTDGDVSVQDAGAQRAAAILAPCAGERVLDCCAAPGGKTAHLLEIADVDLLAVDIDLTRAALVRNNLGRLGLSAAVVVDDCRAPERWWDRRPFDAILADVPCSASGVVRRFPDVKYLRRESDIRRFARQQAGILDRLWPILRPGGRLLYATCSLFPEENDAQIDAFVARQQGVIRGFEERLLPGAEHDGFFYALLHKAV